MKLPANLANVHWCEHVFNGVTNCLLHPTNLHPHLVQSVIKLKGNLAVEMLEDEGSNSLPWNWHFILLFSNEIAGICLGIKKLFINTSVLSNAANLRGKPHIFPFQPKHAYNCPVVWFIDNYLHFNCVIDKTNILIFLLHHFLVLLPWWYRYKSWCLEIPKHFTKLYFCVLKPILIINQLGRLPSCWTRIYTMC